MEVEFGLDGHELEGAVEVRTKSLFAGMTNPCTIDGPLWSDPIRQPESLLAFRLEWVQSVANPSDT